DFPIGVVGMVGEEERVEAMAGERAADPSAGASEASRRLRNLQVEAYVQVVVRIGHRLASRVRRASPPRRIALAWTDSYLGSRRTSSQAGRNLRRMFSGKCLAGRLSIGVSPR